MGAKQLSSEQLEVLTIVSQVVSAFSVCGSAFIILSFVLFPKLRKFSFRLVLWLSFSDLFNQATSFFGNPEDNATVCFIQAFCMQFFSVASFLWTGAIAFVLYQTVVSKKSDIQDNYRKMHYTIWSLAAIFAIVPSWKYGPSGAWCWIEGDDDVGLSLRFVTYYVPLWMVIAYNIYAYACVIKILQRVQKLADSIQNSGMPRLETKAVRKLGWYPIILLVSYFWATVNRIHNWIYPDHPAFALFLLHTIFISLVGTLNSIAYGLNAAVRESWSGLVADIRSARGFNRRAKEMEFHEMDAMDVAEGGGGEAEEGEGTPSKEQG